MITLKTLSTATAQEVFDQVAKHLLTQKERCVDESGRCSYRNNKGLKCAAGCLINDDEYKSYFEGVWWAAFPRRFRGTLKHCDLITKLQSIHDATSIQGWEQGLRNLA